MISHLSTQTIVSFGHPLLGSDLPELVRSFVSEDQFFELRDVTYPGRTSFGQLLHAPSVRVVVSDLYSNAPGLMLSRRYTEVLVKSTDEARSAQSTPGPHTAALRALMDFAVELDIAASRSLEDLFS